MENRRIWPILVILVFYTTLLLSGCTTTPPEETKTQGQVREIILYNWEDYIDKSALDDFEKEFGIKVILIEYDNADQAISNIQSNPQGYDVIITEGRIIEELSQLRLLHKIDLDKIPNFRYIDENFKNLDYDPNNEFSIPYLWGTTSFAIDTRHVPEDTKSLNVFWDEKYKNKIYLLDDTREAIGVVQKFLGFSLNTKNPEEIKQIEEVAFRLKENGVAFGDTFDNMNKLINGEAWIAQVYNGDVIYSTKDKPEIKYILPEEGFVIWVDNFAISADSTKKEAAHKLIDYLLRPDINARNAEKYSYATPNLEARRYISKESLENPVVYPNNETLKKGEFIISAGIVSPEYQRIFSRIR